MPFGPSLHEAQRFMQETSRQIQMPVRPSVCPVVALRPVHDGVGLQVLESAEPGSAGFALFLPRISALEEAASLAWQDEQYLPPHQELTRMIRE